VSPEKEPTVIVNDPTRPVYVTCVSNVHGKGCGARLSTARLQYIRTHWYVQPYSCTGGDYWNVGEGNFYCPKCGHRNRLGFRDEREKARLGVEASGAAPSSTIRQFGSVVNEHWESGDPPGNRVTAIIPWTPKVVPPAERRRRRALRTASEAFVRRALGLVGQRPTARQVSEVAERVRNALPSAS
jgi:hypothetical protein